jgi:hypothetical protein
MEAIKLLEPYFLQLKAWIIHATYCVESPIHAPACRNFWEGAMVAAFAIAILLTLLIGKRLLKEQLEFRRNEKRLKARATVADLDAMEQHKWKTD